MARSVLSHRRAFGSTTWSRRRYLKELYPLSGRRPTPGLARREGSMSRISHVSGNGRNVCSVISLNLEVREPLLVGYFDVFEEPERTAKALEALKVGVIAMQTATPTLDSQVVRDQFMEMQNDFGEALARYFAEKD